MSPLSLFISAGDASGDLHAANLMAALRELEPQARFAGLGLDRMRGAGLEPIEGAGITGGSLGMGNLLRLLEHRRRLVNCRRFLRERRPDAVVLVDYGGFNLYLARAAARLGIPVVYYILPQMWAHGRYRLKKVRKWVTLSLAIYPFEPPLYRACGVEALYVGHPLFDELHRRPPGRERVEELRRALGERLVALFPGSRRHEVQAHLPLMLRAASLLAGRFPDARFATVVPGYLEAVAEPMLARADVEVAMPRVRTVELARAARLCITKSGTITLEIGSQLTPMVIMYRMNPFAAFFARGLGQTPFFGLVNSLAGRMVCPERLMWKDEPGWLAARAVELLDSPRAYERCRAGLRDAMDGFARPGASERAARAILGLLRRG